MNLNYMFRKGLRNNFYFKSTSFFFNIVWEFSLQKKHAVRHGTLWVIIGTVSKCTDVPVHRVWKIPVT